MIHKMVKSRFSIGLILTLTFACGPGPGGTAFAGTSVSTTGAGGGTAQLNLAGDLVIHPAQLATIFNDATQAIKASAAWSWPSFTFAQPYHTTWTGVQANGPFHISFSTAGMANQQIGFELDWTDPSLNIGQFQIHDTATTSVGGVNVIVNLDGQCDGMSVTIPSGQWKVAGQLGWTWANGAINLNWQSFQFTMNAGAVPQANFGRCQGPSGLKPALQQALNAALANPSWLSSVIQSGMLAWVQSAMPSLEGQLLQARSIRLKPGLDLTWQPSALSGLPGGLVRILGQFTMQAPAATSSLVSLPRSYQESDLAAVKESQFLLPKNTVQAALSFLYKTGHLSMRAASNEVPAFTSLMQNPLAQFFIWPDLMSFAENTLFYFDLTTSQAPTVSEGGILDQGGVGYTLRAPLLVHQWAPAGSKYLPYLDFFSQLNGQLDAVINNQTLTLSVIPEAAMNVSARFRREYAAYRQPNTSIDTSSFGQSVQDYLSGQSFSVAMPSWAISSTLSIQIVDLQQWTESFRIPVQ